MSTPHQFQDEEMGSNGIGIGNGTPPTSSVPSVPVGSPSIPTSIMNVPLDMNTSSVATACAAAAASTVLVPPPENDSKRRMVAVRYFLDRPGYGLHNSAVRFWMDPPTMCVPSDIYHFLLTHGILFPRNNTDDDDGSSTPIGDSSNSPSFNMSKKDRRLEPLMRHHREDDFLVEVYLDQFQSFMLIQACEDAKMQWNLSNSTIQHPSSFNVRLTDIDHHQEASHPTESSVVQPPIGTSIHANTTPVGLFSLSLMLGLETVFAMERLIRDPNGNNFFFGIDPAYVVTWGPYMVFSGGGLMWISGILQVFRNNIYGAVAFLVFGSFWFANGTKVILETHFSGPGTRAYELKQVDSYNDPWGTMIRLLYTMGLVTVLLVSTFAGSKVTTILMSVLFCKFICQICAEWSDIAGWIQVFFGWIASWLAFYLFLVDMTNQVFHREVFALYKWSEDHSPGEIFAQPGNGHQTLYSKSQRAAKRNVSNLTKVRMALHRSGSLILNHGKKTK